MGDRKVIYVGIDPGTEGAIAIIYPDNTIALYDIPIASIKRQGAKQSFKLPDRHAAIEILKPLQGQQVRAIVEKVQVDDRDHGNLISAEILVRSAEMWATALTAIGAEVVELLPSHWRKLAGLTTGSNKEAALEEATYRYPQVAGQLYYKSRNGRYKREYGRAEALLMADGWRRH